MANRATFELDTEHTAMIATGNVAAVTVYNPDAAPNAPRVQETDPQTGAPMWVADFLVDDEGERANVAGVRFTSHGLPVFPKFQPVKFDRLTASVYVNKKTGQLGLSYTGELTKPNKAN